MLPQAIERFLSENGRRGGQVLSYLGKHQGLVEAMKTAVGIEILNSASARHDYLARKVLNGDATPEEAAERKALYHIMCDWCEIINNYEKALQEVKKYDV